MRESCKNCVRKHLAQAIILIGETELGYPEHKWLAIGHLAEAESEALSKWPAVASMIRDIRKLYELGETRGEGIMEIINFVGSKDEDQRD